MYIDNELNKLKFKLINKINETTLANFFCLNQLLIFLRNFSTMNKLFQKSNPL